MCRFDYEFKISSHLKPSKIILKCRYESGFNMYHDYYEVNDVMSCINVIIYWWLLSQLI